MRSTFKKLSAMALAFLMVVTMASVLAVSAAVSTGRYNGSGEVQTLGTSANYQTIINNTRAADGSYFADSIAVWGWNNVTSASPLSNQNGIDILVTIGASKNIYIDLSSWSNPTNAAKWAKYGTSTITVGFNATKTNGVMSWTKVPTSGVDASKMLQFFTFKVDADGQQIQLFDTDTTANIANGGDNGVFNVLFQECTKTVWNGTATVPGAATTGIGYVVNMDASAALGCDFFYGTHAYTTLFGYDFNLAGQTSYNTAKTNAAVDFLLSSGTVATTQWNVATGAYATTNASASTNSLSLSLLKKYFSTATPTGKGLTDGTADYAQAALDAFYAMTSTSDGYGFTVKIADPRIGTSTLVPSDATVTYTFAGLKGNLSLTWLTSNAVTGLQTATATGGEKNSVRDGRLVANQTQTLTASEAEAGKLMLWEYVSYTSVAQPFGVTSAYPVNQNNYVAIVYKTARAAQSDWNFDSKITTLASEMNLVDATTPGKVDVQLVPVIGGDLLTAGLKTADNKSKTLRDYGYTLNYYVDYTNNFMSQLTLDIHDKTLADITTGNGKANFVVNIAKGSIVSAYSCTITQYDETFVIPLQDGTYTLLRIKVKTNFDDKVSPLNVKDITDFDYSRLTFAGQLKLYNDRLVDANGTRVYNSNANKVIYVDLINAIPGYGSTYYWNYDSNNVGTAKVDGYNGVKYYSKLTALLSYVGFNTDGSKPVRNPVGYAKFYNTIDSTVSLTAQQLYDTSFRMVYVKGTGDAQESVVLTYYPLTPAQTLNYVAADGNTYVYSMFFHTQYGDMPVAATSLGVAQKSDAKITAMGNYTYAIATTGKSTGKGAADGDYSVGACTRTETKGVITITNYWDNTRGQNNQASGVSNYNKAITTLAVRIPAGATLSLDKTGSGVEAKVVKLEYGTLGLNTVDGLVDAYVTIQYSTVSNTTFTLTVNYDDGPNDGVKGYNGFSRSWDVTTTWVVRTDANPDTTNAASVAYNKFTSTLGKTLTPAAAVMPSNPNSVQVKSSTPSMNSIVSAPSATSTPAMGNPFNAIAYIITVGASAIGGISTLVIRKRK